MPQVAKAVIREGESFLGSKGRGGPSCGASLGTLVDPQSETVIDRWAEPFNPGNQPQGVALLIEIEETIKTVVSVTTSIALRQSKPTASAEKSLFLYLTALTTHLVSPFWVVLLGPRPEQMCYERSHQPNEDQTE